MAHPLKFAWAVLPVSCVPMAAVMAAPMLNFDAAAFDAARRAGTPILIETYAGWCHICWMQAPIVQGIVDRPEFARVRVFVVDFDSQKKILRQFGVQKQSTLIVFKGAQEVGRSVGEVRPTMIEALLRQAL